MKKHLLLAIIFSLTITACGFHLRGQKDLPPALHKIYLQADNPYGSLESRVAQNLRSSGVILVNAADEAPITLRLSSPVKTDSGAAIGTSNQARVYTQTYSITFTLTNSRGKVLTPPQTLTTSRSLILTPNQLPQSNNQSEVMYQEMERDIVNQLYNRLHAKQIVEALRAY